VTYVHSSDCDELRIILCLEFDPQAEPERVAELKSAVIESPNTLHSVEVTGDFDFMTEIAAGDLGWFNRWWKSLAKLVAAVVSRCEKSFICKRFIRRPKDEQALWVRRGDELKRLDHALIDKIVADGDYARVYSQGQSWLLHATMHSLFERLNGRHFVQLHRSVIVRSGFIDRLVHENDHWIAFLRDGTPERVARSHAAETLKIVRSSSNGAASSNTPQAVDNLQLR
jgi:hypothetical protein